MVPPAESASAPEFSFRTREESLRRFARETFDLLVVGGGITGAAVAREAASRGLSVALVEKHDFASGTSSASSKLIHGGLRYLENFELGLVFEALAERAFLLRTAPHMVRPLPFYLPVYEGDAHGKTLLNFGLWLYDLLALFRAPEFHHNLSKEGMLKDFPFLAPEKLKGGFRYFDASMWDDALVIETLRAANTLGVAIANYAEALNPLFSPKGARIEGFTVRDRESGREVVLRARRTVLCGGPWTDELGRKLSPDWRPWLKPSQGAHIVFDHTRLPVPGAVVMSHPGDGRIIFVIPRPDFGPGVTVVGTTDGPPSGGPESLRVSAADIEYLMALLHKYFPTLELKTSDILSSYVGLRPLVEGVGASQGNVEGGDAARMLQKVSREHHIDQGPGGTVLVAGGKYTTHRRMAMEIVDFTLKLWRREYSAGVSGAPPIARKSGTAVPVNPRATSAARAEAVARSTDAPVPAELLDRYGAEALEVHRLGAEKTGASLPADPPGFPALAGQLRFAIRNEGVMHLRDFYFRRVPLFLARADHGLPWAEALAAVWAEERGLSAKEIQAELAELRAETGRRDSWKA